MDDGDADADTDGGVFTVTVTDADFVHPAVFVPVTVYVVELLGVTVILDPLPPVDQVYVSAPLAVSIELCPGHMDDGDADADTVGGVFTVTLTDATPTHPLIL